MTKNDRILPCVALRGLVILPKMVLHFDVVRQKSIDAVKEAMKNNSLLFLVTQKDDTLDNPSFDDLYSMGTIAEIKQVMFNHEQNSARVVAEGISRAKLTKILSDNPYILAQIKIKNDMKIKPEDREYASAALRYTKKQYRDYFSFLPNKSPEIVSALGEYDDLSTASDYMASTVPTISYDNLQFYLANLDPIARVVNLGVLLKKEREIQKIENKISQDVEDQMDKNQKEYYLRESMKAISNELGGNDDIESEVAELKAKIEAIANIDDKSRKKLLKDCDRLLSMGAAAGAEAAVLRTYIETCLDLPWDISKDENKDIKAARKILERDHYGLLKVKDKIIESLAVKILNPENDGRIICLVGPPGVGKTSIAKSLAEAMGRDYVRISLGGIHDEAEIRGHRRTYIGSMPGRVINAMINAGSNNPLMLFDEVDKLASDYKGDPSSALLEVLDSEQNNKFVDHYIDLPFDLSHVFFITTANDASSIPEPLYDRMDVIELPSYTADEKYHIAKEHLLGKQLKRHGLTTKQLDIGDDVINAIINDYTREAGVRNLERSIAKICSKAADMIVEDNAKSIKVSSDNVKDFLGNPKYKNKAELCDQTGVTNGLAWTSVGGEMLKVEAAVVPGKGSLELTGSLGDVMKESAKAALTYIRGHADDLGIKGEFYKDKDIHVHVPEGATPKDGPSAGVTMATSILSALTGKTVKGNLAMTGEITLTGRVLPIGGLREKSMAAYKAGIKTVIIPDENVPDLSDVADVVKDNIEFVSVKNLSEVFKLAVNDNDAASVKSVEHGMFNKTENCRRVGI